ncbi:MAG: hypothetical protein IPK79_02435 [Vampirovibrionales bacterium]|nr:hypothetical protein [Vampirovibrionales bacterium]
MANFRVLAGRRFIGAMLAASLLLSACGPAAIAGAQAFGDSMSHGQGMTMAHLVTVPGGHKLVTVEAADANVRELLRDMARQGGFNLILDESVKGTVTLELHQVAINQALSAIASLAALEILPRSDHIFLAIARKSAVDKGLNRRLTRMIPVKFGNAAQIAAMLNTSLFAIENAELAQLGGGGSGGASVGLGGGGATACAFQKVKADSRTNSLLIVGSQRELDLAQAAADQIDRPRESRTFYLSYANALDVATQLTSSIFNDGTAGFIFQNGGGGGGGAGGASGGGAGASVTGGAGAAAGGAQGPLDVPSSLRVQSEKVSEGTGVNNLAGGGTGSSSFSQELVLRGTVKTTEMAQISPLGPLVIPDTRLNAVTVMGTPEQIDIAERMIPVFDAEPPQVSIDVSMVEITHQGLKELGARIGVADGKLQTGFNNQPLPGLKPISGIITPGGTGLVGLPTNDLTDTANRARSGIIYSTNPLVKKSDYLFQLNALVNNRRAKILANPTIVAAHDTEAVVSIVDEIIRRVNVTVDGQTGTTTVETEMGEAGVVLDILPKIGEDGTVSMRIRPSVTTIRSILTDAQGNITTLLTKRDILAQLVRIKDGQTLVLGGLVQEARTNRQDKLPLVGDLPIVGALFRAAQNDTSRSEIVLLLTPHILNKTRTTPTHTLDPLSSQATGAP